MSGWLASPPKIVGIIQCKNEWALNAISIAHALLHHVDEILVVDDSSTDRSHHGLARLRQLWPDRLHVVSMRGDEYLQEAAVAAALHLCRAYSPDWIYVLDADEFLVVEDGRSLREILAALPPECVALRYPIRNFIAVDGLDACALSDYPRIRRRAVPRQDLRLSDEECARAIHAGQLTFFDCPFSPKVIFRHSAWLYPGPGAHVVRQVVATEGSEAVSREVWAAHVPYLTRDRLDRKAAMGRRHLENGDPPWHGWQNQLAHRLEQEGRLDWFWERHSVPASGEPGPLSPAGVPDQSFATAVLPALAFLEEGLRSGHLSRVGTEEIPVGAAEETQLPLQEVVRLQAKASRCLSAAEARWLAAEGERDQARAERERVAAERDAALGERGAACAERDRAAAERDAARAERDRAEVERDAARAERDRLEAERTRMVRSWSWRLTKPFRKLRSHARHLRPGRGRA